MRSFFKTRRDIKSAREVLRQARHLRNMREDVMPAADLARLDAAIEALRGAIASRANFIATAERVGELTDKLTPQKWKSGFRENVDVLIVAVAIAMAFRAYCFQPFKIPTGSMQPTLNGITSLELEKPTIWDRVPLNILQFAWSATYYRTYRAKNSGTVGNYGQCKNPSKLEVHIGGVRHRLPKDAVAREEVPHPGVSVHKGDVLWAGRVHLGDHLFVDKFAWNFRKPRRGEIMVFETDGLPNLTPHTHYIKRMCGTPHDSLRIERPNLFVNGQLASEPTIRRVASAADGYSGYCGIGVREIIRDDTGRGRIDMVPQEMWPPIGPDLKTALMERPNLSDVLRRFKTSHSEIALGDGQYVAFGDNTTSSYDSRYWGPVSVSNLVGPATFVYWPFGKHWGLSR